ncbi:MAG: hypothetical protein LAP21_15200 [Acidobacteriia bacterium]|nr:hypothetical protein [Terriglobia bacterium]
MATRKRRTKTTTAKYVLVRGRASNPVPMIASKRKGALNGISRLLRTHFPYARVRVQKVKI